MPERLRTAITASAMSVYRNLPMMVVLAVAMVIIMHAAPALAQADPFVEAREAACTTQRGLTKFAGVVGILGMTACLLLGYFNKLNWRWLATGIGVSFFINTVPGWVMSLAGGGC